MNYAHSFAATLLEPNAPAPAGLSDGQGHCANARFNVYRNNVAVSLVDALEASFPVVTQLVGSAFFRAMAGVALRQAPPTSPVMAGFGSHFPAFLEEFPPVSHLPYLADVARIENAVRRAYHAADVAAFDTCAMRLMDPADLMACTFRLAPAVSLHRSAYPAGTVWLNHQLGAQPQPLSGAEHVVISRPVFDPMVDLLPPGAAQILQACDGQTSFETAVAVATDPDLPATLHLMLTRGLVYLT